MLPDHHDLCALLDGHRHSIEPEKRAYAENVLLEERVGEHRARVYTQGLPPALADFRTWVEAHNDFVAKTVFVELPVTFVADNAMAALSDDIDGTLHFIRVERIDGALRDIPELAVARLALAADIIHARLEDATMNTDDARALAQDVCDYINTHKKRSRPKFASFLHDLNAEQINPPTAGWPDRLRNRLGLAHHDPSDGKPIPVALFRYPVSSVYAATAATPGAAHAIAVPAVLDAPLNSAFHPAPAGLDSGRAVDLAHDRECERMTAEVLHLRIDYLPDHLWAVDAIVTRPPVTPPLPEGPGVTKLATLREWHLFCLRYWSGRDDFGAPRTGMSA